MKKKTTTTINKYDDKGNIIESTETTVEEEYSDYPYQPYTPLQPYPYQPFITWDTTTPPTQNYTITCDGINTKDLKDFVNRFTNNIGKI